MKKIALVLAGALCFQSPLSAWWGQFTNWNEMEKSDKRLWEAQVHEILGNPSVSKEKTWIKYLQDRKLQSQELLEHFHTIIQEEYFKSWRRARRVQLSRLIKLTEGVLNGMDTEALLRLRKSMPTPPSMTNKVVSLTALAALGAGLYYWHNEQRHTQEPTQEA